jgi:hypothetical protein
LKPSTTVAVDTMGNKAVVMEWAGAKPCWVSVLGRESVTRGRRSLSRILTAGESRVIGSEGGAMVKGLSGFWDGNDVGGLPH